MIPSTQPFEVLSVSPLYSMVQGSSSPPVTSSPSDSVKNDSNDDVEVIKYETSDSDSVSKTSNFGLKLKTKYLRRGKWTIEEENFSNKVIELFTKGLLKLDEESKGITLRAYLANKLECDPMRITKKYAGAYCLGKRVYQFDKLNVTNEEIEKANEEMKQLEKYFHQKIESLTKKRLTETVNTSQMVSTPAIDALLRKDKPLIISSDNKSITSDSSFASFPATTVLHSNPTISVTNNIFNPIIESSSASHFQQQFIPYPVMLNSNSNRFIIPSNTQVNSVPITYPCYFVNTYHTIDQKNVASNENDPYISLSNQEKLEKRKMNGEYTSESIYKRSHTISINEEDSAAANSLLGLFNQVRNNQGDLQEFLQKSIKVSSNSAEKLISSSL